jgi:hypothetical protein
MIGISKLAIQYSLSFEYCVLNIEDYSPGALVSGSEDPLIESCVNFLSEV